MSPAFIVFVAPRPHLIPQSIAHVQQLETVDQDHGQWWGTSELHLLHQHAQVYHHLRATTDKNIAFKPKLYKHYLRKSLRRNFVSFQPTDCRFHCVPVALFSVEVLWNLLILLTVFKRFTGTLSTGCVTLKAESFPYSTGSKSLPHTVCRQSVEAFSVLTYAYGFKTLRSAKVCTGYTDNTENHFEKAQKFNCLRWSAS